MGFHDSSETQQSANVCNRLVRLRLSEDYHKFRDTFTENEYGHKFYVCDHLWYLSLIW